MKEYRIIYMDAFTSEPFSGNPCAVLPEAEGLTDQQMQKIAMETNLSETAFVFRSEKAGVRVRYFMPRKEIPFAGHPTIATAMMLIQEEMIPSQSATVVIDFEFNIGILPVEVHLDARRQPSESDHDATKTILRRMSSKREDLRRCFGVDKKDFLDEAPIQVVSTGVPFLIVPVTAMDILKKVQVRSILIASFAARCRGRCRLHVLPGRV